MHLFQDVHFMRGYWKKKTSFPVEPDYIIDMNANEQSQKCNQQKTNCGSWEER